MQSCVADRHPGLGEDPGGIDAVGSVTNVRCLCSGYLSTNVLGQSSELGLRSIWRVSMGEAPACALGPVCYKAEARALRPCVMSRVLSLLSMCCSFLLALHRLACFLGHPLSVYVLL